MKFKLLFLFLFCGYIASAQKIKPVQVPGTHCSLIPPKGFILDKDRSGFIDSGAVASIVVGEMPMPLDTMISEFSEENFRKHDGLLISRETVSGKGAHAVLLHAEQVLHDNKYQTLILVFGDDKTSVIVVGNYPYTSKHLEPVIKAAILSTVYSKANAGKAPKR